MGHLNELHNQYKDKGLVVIGITTEPRSKVDAFCDKNSPEYPIVIESSDSIRAYQSNSFPTVVLIGANGRILSTEHPSDQSIEAALDGVRMLPAFPKSLSAVRKSMKKDQYAKALDKLEKAAASPSVSDDDKAAAREIIAWIAWFGESSLEAAVKDRDGDEVYMAWQSLDYLGDAFKGHEIGTQAAAAAKAIMKDKGMKLEVKAGRAMDEVRTEMAGAATAKSALKCLKPLLSKKYADTKAGKEARKLADELEAKIGK